MKKILFFSLLVACAQQTVADNNVCDEVKKTLAQVTAVTVVIENALTEADAEEVSEQVANIIDEVKEELPVVEQVADILPIV
jgi:hypothetical protein